MAKIAITVDVNAGLDYVGYDTGIPCLRSTVNFGEEILVDGIDITADQFYKRIMETGEIPSTSMAALGDVMDLFEKLIAEGYTDLIHFPISFALSGGGPSVLKTGEEYADKIRTNVVDTKSAVYLQGFMALEAKRMADAGASVEQILAHVNKLVESQRAYFVVDNLNYLVKNGRLSGAAGFLGGMLKIKPVLELNKEGRIVSKEKIKTHRKAIERIVELILEDTKYAKKIKLMVFHSSREDGAKELAETLKQARPDVSDIEIHFITPAVGAHVGYGVLGVGCFILD
ncbi:MAG TPA: DegV family protein [Bacilli bacterium]|nr:DegV family protein [Bacilli bacterium]